jgi:hypothetical protein
MQRKACSCFWKPSIAIARLFPDVSNVVVSFHYGDDGSIKVVSHLARYDGGVQTRCGRPRADEVAHNDMNMWLRLARQAPVTCWACRRNAGIDNPPEPRNWTERHQRDQLCWVPNVQDRVASIIRMDVLPGREFKPVT